MSHIGTQGELMAPTDPEAIPDVLARKVRYYRESQDLRQEDLAERMTELGWPMNRVTVAKIEAGGTRAANVSVAEMLVLAAALDVPPLLLFLPLGDVEDMTIGTETVHPHLVLDWVAGDTSFVMGNRRVRNQTAWFRNAQPLFLFRQLRELQNTVQRAWPHESLAPVPHRSQEQADEALAQLAKHLEYMRQAGLSVPEMPDEWQKRMAELGLLNGEGV
jgi:transcriptional regulator with XRE-family HTH domain